MIRALFLLFFVLLSSSASAQVKRGPFPNSIDCDGQASLKACLDLRGTAKMVFVGTASLTATPDATLNTGSGFTLVFVGAGSLSCGTSVVTMDMKNIDAPSRAQVFDDNCDAGEIVRGSNGPTTIEQNWFGATNAVQKATAFLNGEDGHILVEGVPTSISSSVNTLQEAYDGSGGSPAITVGANGLTFHGVNDQASAHRLCETGDTSKCQECYWDPTEGFTCKVTPAASRTEIIANNQAHIVITDTEEYTRIDEASRQTRYGPNNRPQKPLLWDAGSVSTDGTNCQTPTESTINSGPKGWGFGCQDGGSFWGKFRMPAAMDEGATLSLILSFYTVGTSSVTWDADVSAQCRGVGDVINNTWGTAVQGTVASGTTDAAVREATSNSITPNGSCSEGDWVFWRVVIDDANSSATQTTLKVMGGLWKLSFERDREQQ